jgi:mannose-6-phosphate isomerase-like protein (cupin superfamily)
MGLMEQLQERIESNAPTLVSKAIQPTYQWDTAVGYLQHCADNLAGQPIGILEYKLPMADQIDSVKPVVTYLSENLKEEILGTDMYVSLTTQNDTKYKSNNDILLYNVIGYSDFRFAEEQRTVEPGDLLYIPKGTEYSFKPLMARSYLIISLAKGRVDDNEVV